MDAQFSLIPLLFVLFSLLVGALLKLVLRRSAFPYTVGLFCFGLLIGALDSTCLQMQAFFRRP